MRSQSRRLSTMIGTVAGLVLLAFVSPVAISQAGESTVPVPSQQTTGAKGDPGQVQERAIRQGGRAGFGYTCTDDGIEKKCTCTGFDDCQRLKDNRDCCVPQPGGGCSTILECPIGGNTCTCTMALTKPPTKRPHFTAPLAPMSGVTRRGVDGEKPTTSEKEGK